MTRQRRRGYVLVVTLGLLVLAATLLVSIGRASLRRAAAAREAAEDLQRRWGVTSCRLAVMPAVESVLVDQERKLRRPVAVHRTSLTLGGQRFDLVLADEQAKANLNVLLDESDVPRVETRLREVTRLRKALAVGGVGHLLRLRPDPSAVPPQRTSTTSPATRPIVPQRVTGFGQIFDGAAPEALAGPSELVTCWGSGLLNVRRASPAAIRLATPLSGIEIAGLLRAREAPPAGGLVKSTGIKPRPGLHLTESSSCHSLWIVARTGRREWRHFTVLDESSEPPVAASFVW